MGLSISCT